MNCVQSRVCINLKGLTVPVSSGHQYLCVPAAPHSSLLRWFIGTWPPLTLRVQGLCTCGLLLRRCFTEVAELKNEYKQARVRFQGLRLAIRQKDQMRVTWGDLLEAVVLIGHAQRQVAALIVVIATEPAFVAT